eukprot:gene10193-13087_t
MTPRIHGNGGRGGGSSPEISSGAVSPVVLESKFHHRAAERNGNRHSNQDREEQLTAAEDPNVVDGYLSVEFSCSTASVPPGSLESITGESTSFLDAHRLVGGSGIGLKWRISQDIVRRHGGVLVVRAGEGEGSGLYVQMYLPCARQPRGVDDVSRVLSSPPPLEDSCVHKHENVDQAEGERTTNIPRSPPIQKLSKVKQVIQPRPLDLARSVGWRGYAEVGEVKPNQKEPRTPVSQLKIFPSLDGSPVVSRGVTDASPTSEFMWINMDRSNRHPRKNADRDVVENSDSDNAIISPRLNAVRGVWDPRLAGSRQERLLDSDPTICREESGTTEHVKASVTLGSIASTVGGIVGRGADGYEDSRDSGHRCDPVVPFDD